MPSPLALPSLVIQGYRGIRELKIERLGRANLIVGKNSVGKTSVLEAIRLYAQPASLETLFDILQSREEFKALLPEKPPAPLSTATLFHGRREGDERGAALSIGKIGHESSFVHISNTTLSQLKQKERKEIAWMWNMPGSSKGPGRFLRFKIGGDEVLYPLANAMFLATLRGLTGGENEKFKSARKPLSTVPANGQSSDLLGELWDEIALTSREDEVLKAVRIVYPEIDRVVFKTFMDAIHPRVGFAKLLKSEHPVQLRSLGDGVNRLFGIAVSLVNALGGFCVIDEIENGIHYSVQADVWRFIFKLATQLDVQVFATTHSWDMVKAFQLAADESEEEGVLIRLARTGDRLWVAEYDEHDLEIAVDREIEVR